MVAFSRDRACSSSFSGEIAIAWARLAFRKLAPSKLTPLQSAQLKLALVRSVLLRFAPGTVVKRAWGAGCSAAPVKSASPRLAPVKSAPPKYAPLEIPFT